MGHTCLFHIANIMATDVLATQGARVSATMILTSQIRFFLKKVRGQKHHKEVDECRNDFPYINHFLLGRYCPNPVQDNQWPEKAILSPICYTSKYKR